ncbi:MAG: 50S ribosomal protein L20 [Endomicrobiales bacterium]|nr:50S ribosomal protein L20 [Endomicrobiales bacterium]
MRVRSVTYTRQRKKKFFRISKGYYSNKNNRWRMAIQQIEKSLRYAYADRKDRKRNFRKLWITRLNAAVRQMGLNYSRFISGLRKANIVIDRKMLAELAVNDMTAFQQLVEIAKSTLSS